MFFSTFEATVALLKQTQQINSLTIGFGRMNVLLAVIAGK